MKRVRRKETNNLRSIKKLRESHKNDSISNLPKDLIIEILAKLPAKSIAIIIVSKLWSSTIRSNFVTELYLARSSTQPQFMLAIKRHRMHILHCFSEEDPSLSSSGQHHSVSITPDPDFYQIYQPSRGLICCRYNTKVVIGNPSTGQFLTLPRVKTSRRHISTYFGYDPVNDVYKVLCMTLEYGFYYYGRPELIDSEEHQVFTLGRGQQKTWRMIECKHPHHPHLWSRGLCKNGVVYYFAWIKKNEQSLISFDLISEDFNAIKLPKDVNLLQFDDVVKYSGKIALTSHYCNGTLDLLVLEDANKQEWSRVSVLVPSWADLVVNRPFKFMGALSTGVLIFSPESSPHPFYILSYDPKENNTKKFVIKGLGDDFVYAQVFLDHVESPMVLPKGPLMKSFPVSLQQYSPSGSSRISDL